MSGRTAVFVNARIVRMRFRPAVLRSSCSSHDKEGRVEGVWPVQVEIGGHRVEATEAGPRRWAPPR